MTYLNYCQQLYRGALQRMYGDEVSRFEKIAVTSLVDQMYGSQLSAMSLLKQVETLLTAVKDLQWRYGAGWVRYPGSTYAIPLDSRSTQIFKTMFEPQVSLWTPKTPSLRDVVDGKLMYRVDTYSRLLDWEARYEGNGFPHPYLPQNTVRQIVQAATIFECRSELDLMYFSKYGEYGRELREGAESNPFLQVQLKLTADNFAALTSWFLDFTDALKALEAGQRAGASGRL